MLSFCTCLRHVLYALQAWQSVKGAAAIIVCDICHALCSKGACLDALCAVRKSPSFCVLDLRWPPAELAMFLFVRRVTAWVLFPGSFLAEFACRSFESLQVFYSTFYFFFALPIFNTCTNLSKITVAPCCVEVFAELVHV